MKVLISGYFGFGNVGDEAVLAATIQALRQQEPKLEITVLTNDWRSEPEYQAQNRSDLPAVIAAIRQTDVFISGGGTLFQDSSSSRSFWYYIGLLWLAKLFGKKNGRFSSGFWAAAKKR